MRSTQCVFSSSVYSIKFVNLSLLDNIVEREFSEEVTLAHSCPWVGLTRGLGWVRLGREWVDNLFLVGWVGSWV